MHIFPLPPNERRLHPRSDDATASRSDRHRDSTLIETTGFGLLIGGLGVTAFAGRGSARL